MNIIKYERVQGERLPPFCYGLAYREISRPVAVFYLVPINYIIRFVMYISHRWDRYRSRPSWVDKKVEEEVHRRISNLSMSIVGILREDQIMKFYVQGNMLHVETSMEIGNKRYQQNHQVSIEEFVCGRVGMLDLVLSKIRQEIRITKGIQG